MDLTRLFGRAWQITWRHRALWVFGLLLAIFEGGVSINTGSNVRTGPTGPGSGGFGDGAFPELSLPLVAALVAVGLILLLALYAFSVAALAVGRGGLIGGAAAADDGADPGVGDCWRLGREHFTGLVVLQLLTIPVFLVFVLIAAAAVAAPLLFAVSVGQRDQSAFWIGAALAALGFFVVLAASVVVSTVVRLIVVLASLVVVFESQSAIESIRMAIRLIRRRPGPVLLVWLVLGLVGLVIAIAAATPMVLVGFALVVATLAQPTLWPVFLLIALPALAIVLGVGAIWQTFRMTTWSLAYRDWRSGLVEGAGPPIVGPVQVERVVSPPAGAEPNAQPGEVAAKSLSLEKPGPDDGQDPNP